MADEFWWMDFFFTIELQKDKSIDCNFFVGIELNYIDLLPTKSMT